MAIVCLAALIGSCCTLETNKNGGGSLVVPNQNSIYYVNSVILIYVPIYMCIQIYMNKFYILSHPNISRRENIM